MSDDIYNNNNENTSDQNAKKDLSLESERDPTGGQIPDDIFKPREDQDKGQSTDAQQRPPQPSPPKQGSQPASSQPGDGQSARPQADALPSQAQQNDQNAPPNDPVQSANPQKRPVNPDTGKTKQATQPKKKKFSFKSAGLGSKSDTPEQPAATKKPAGNKGNVPRGALNAVVTRNEYYRDGYRNLMKIAFLEGIMIVGLIVAFVVYMNVHQERNRYFATTADGRILQLAPLDQPNISQAALMSWVSQAATETMTFGFHDYQRRLQEASRHFTRHGWESFTNALQRSRIIESVETLQQVVTATPRSAPVLLQQGVFNGRYRWVVRLPLTVTYTSGNRTTSDNLEVTITIERVPTLESPNGVGIESWIAV